MTRYFFIAGLLTITCCTMMSCGGGSDRSGQQVKPASKTSKQVTDSSVHQDTRPITEDMANDTLNEVMGLKDIRLNGVLPRYFSLKEFRKTLGEPDSTKLLLDEEPCTSIFEEPDGSVDAKALYLFKNGSRFECSKQKVAIDEANFTYGDHLMFKGHRLDGNTTVADLKKIFPNACKHIGTMDVHNDGQLQVITLREDSNNVSDGHINVFIRDGKLYKLHWWFPC